MNKKITIIGILIVLLAVFAAGCVEQPVEPVLVEPAAEEPQEPIAEEPVVEKPPIFSVGDTVEIGNFRITVNSARWWDGAGFFIPKEGENALIIDCTIENIGNTDRFISNFMFTLVDENYFKQEDVTFFVEPRGRLSGKLGRGIKIRGEVAFRVLENQTKWNLIFEPSPFEEGQAIYSIYAKEVN